MADQEEQQQLADYHEATDNFLDVARDEIERTAE